MAQRQSLILIIGLAVILTLLNIELSVACNPAEYKTGDECCPMCSPGNRVYKHCTEYTSTSCIPCVGSTYLDKPNGLTACIQCSYCDPGFGLTVKHPCTPTSDTVCKPLEGFYCTDPYKDGCKVAQKHSSCNPGQYISQKGTTSRDTVCVDCTGDSYSNGSFTSCQPHTKCENLNLEQITSGTPGSDSECESPAFPTAVVASVVVPLIGVILVILLILRFTRNQQRAGSNEPTLSPDPTTTISLIESERPA
ncbi:hypothetical protein UPYG_G00004520 [Umbra pygmaea]|uniref:TNFR-Cys domain-containing protein n=1 Tax=Umbra pygmaea TaxID=75934 RepID=A0ABD0Y4H7_UMBPY